MSTIKYDNIFEAVTGKEGEAQELQTRADIMSVIRDIVTDKGWKLDEAAEKLRLTQPQADDLLNGKIEGFSTDELMSCLSNLVSTRLKEATADTIKTRKHLVEALTTLETKGN